MTALAQHQQAEALERFLGDPLERSNRFCFARSMALDERDAYPEEACARLEEWGFPLFFVPSNVGGRLGSYEEMLSLWRVVARRDLTVAVAQVITYIGATPVWVTGTDEQKRAVTAIIRERGQLSFALTERGHGSDILAGETAAVLSDCSEYRINGEKWLIGNGNRSRALTLFARTDEGGGPAGFSMLLVDKRALPPGSCAHLSRERTMGLRGMDLSGIRLEDARVPAAAVLQERGRGLEVLLKAQQLARLVICGLSLGAADTALRTTASFAVDRRLYGDSILALPYVRDRLLGAMLDIMICECVLVAGFRGVHAASDQLSLWSAVAKCLVPPRVDHLMSELKLVLGARYFLRDGHDDGIFQKMLRDHMILSVVEGSTAVNLKAVAMQLRTLARFAQRSGEESDGAARQRRLAAVFRLDHPLPEPDFTRLAVTTGGRDDVVQGVSSALRRLQAEATAVDPASLNALLCELAAALQAEIEALHQAVAEMPARYGQTLRRFPQLSKLAERYCLVHAAACCLHLWLHNRDLLEGYAGEGAWLALCLERLLNALGRPTRPLPEHLAEPALSWLVDQLREQRLFSLATIDLAKKAAREAESDDLAEA